MLGWGQTGLHGTEEIKFELSFKNWEIRQAVSTAIDRLQSYNCEKMVLMGKHRKSR